MEATFVIIGGGIAAVTCIETLAIICPEEKTVIITASALVKNATNVIQLGKTITTFDVTETNTEFLKNVHPNLTIIYDQLKHINPTNKNITTTRDTLISYKYLCICTGGAPRILKESDGNPRVLGIRDTDSCHIFCEKLKSANRIVVVGNGGIASEIVHEIQGIEIYWVIKDEHITATFLDPGSSAFFQSQKLSKDSQNEGTIIKRHTFTEDVSHDLTKGISAPALGPDWYKSLQIPKNTSQTNLTIVYEAEVKSIINNTGIHKWPLCVELTNGQTVDCDLLISATGVQPCINFSSDEQFALGTDGSISVGWNMETSIKDIFAAGDVVHANWEIAPHWFQMRLWTQARQMGIMAARGMQAALTGEEIYQDFCFELFSHTTKLFGYQVILLGKYNAQGFGSNYEMLIRTTPHLEYIKFVLVNGKLQGAILIGETGLEETCENLILNQLDLSPYGIDILNPDIDIEDYFD